MYKRKFHKFILGFSFVAVSILLICLPKAYSKESINYGQEYLVKWAMWEEKSFEEKISRTLLGYDTLSAAEILTGNMVYQRSAAITVEEDVYWENQSASVWEFKLEEMKNHALSDEVQVIIYHTHNAETYAPTYGVSKVNGQNGGVVQAGDVLKEALERKYGIKVWHSQVLHDYPDWSRSYNNSLKTIQALLKENPQTQVVFDVHRDAGYSQKASSTAVVKGKNAAKILLVLGANHENWQENLVFAQKLENKGAELYPDLIKGIRIAEKNRYNQQAHPHSVIVEVGSDLNTQEEADYAMECFAHICAEVMQEMER